MKKMFAVVATALMVSATIAQAATPAAPVMSMAVKSTKVANGANWSNDGGRELIVDGSNVYAAFHGPNGEPSVIRSTDGGLTWGQPAVLAADNSSNSIRITLTKDPVYTGKKILFATWGASSGAQMYSYFVDRPTGTTWTAPAQFPWVSPYGYGIYALGAAPNGTLHIIYDDGTGTYYASAASAEAAFTTPVQLPWTTSNNSMTFDSNSNMYVVETHDTVAGPMLSYHKKSAGGTTWSTIDVAKSDATYEVNDNVSIAVYDANNIYIAFKFYPLTVTNAENHVWLAATSNGGNSWSKRIVTPNATVYGTHPSITVNSSKVVTIAAHYVNYGPDGRISINRTSDNGATWSANVTVPGNNQASTALDSTGKVCVLSNSDATIDTFLNGSLGSPAALYFSREK